MTLVLLSFKNFRTVLILLVIIYTLYFVWDLLKIGEYREEFKKPSKETSKERFKEKLQRYRRELVSIVSCVLFLILSFAYFYKNLPEWWSLVFAIVISVFYRINKIIPLWERIFGVNEPRPEEEKVKPE